MSTFNIRLSEKAEPGTILVSPIMAEELGIVEGQFLQVQGKERQILKSKIAQGLSPEEAREMLAWVAAESFEKIRGSEAPIEVLEITLGCDPEYFILNNREVINAHAYLPFQGEIGCDGTLAELRPHYGRHENEVTRTLGGLISRVPASLKREGWAGSLPSGRNFSYEAHSFYAGFPAGFHVHLGLPPEVLNTRVEFNRTTLNHLVRCLDWYVSVPLLPLEVAHQRRLSRGKYGKPGDYRPSSLTLEYRTPGAFYLRTPNLARGLMGLCLSVAEDLITKVKKASSDYVKLDKLTPTDLNSLLEIPKAETILSTLGTREPEKARSLLPGIYSAISKLTSFSRHKESIEEFFRIVEKGEKPSPFLVANWKE